MTFLSIDRRRDLQLELRDVRSVACASEIRPSLHLCIQSLFVDSDGVKGGSDVCPNAAVFASIVSQFL